MCQADAGLRNAHGNPQDLEPPCPHHTSQVRKQVHAFLRSTGDLTLNPHLEPPSHTASQEAGGEGATKKMDSPLSLRARCRK